MQDRLELGAIALSTGTGSSSLVDSQESAQVPHIHGPAIIEFGSDNLLDLLCQGQKPVDLLWIIEGIPCNLPHDDAVVFICQLAQVDLCEAIEEAFRQRLAPRG